MNLNDENLVALANYLQQTLSTDSNVRRAAEKFLESIETNQNYAILLLKLVDKNDVNMNIRIAGAIAFKNFVKRNWEINDERGNRINENDRLEVKKYIVELMLHSPQLIQKQLSDAISIIGQYDFPNKWPELIDEMVTKFATGDFNIINGVLVTAHSLFKKYRHMFKSQELWSEIKYVLGKIAQPLTDLLITTMNLAEQHSKNEMALKVIYSSLVLVCKVFYSLNVQDLPEFFEDNMQTWMSNFHLLLVVHVPCLVTNDDEEPGILEQLRTQICENIKLYAQQYDEEFQGFLPQFVTDVWELLISTGQQPKYDNLVSHALSFLSKVADRNHNKGLFEDPNVLNSICEKVIIPNIEFRATDEELFEDNPEEYIRRDIEGSDVDTRRRAACDLVNSLKLHFEARIIEIFGQYIQVMLSRYAENPKTNWKNKDAALYLVMSLAALGKTEKKGVTHTSELVPINQFCVDNVLPELVNLNVNDLPVIKADSIKYIMTFRSILPRELLIATLPHLTKHLNAEAIVVSTYAACALEKILMVKNNQNQPIVLSSDIEPLAKDMLVGLWIVLEKPGCEENEYVMKTIMRTINTLQEISIPYLAQILPKLTEKLQIVAKNPSKPHFNHYLFETLSLCVKIVCKTTPGAVVTFEDALFPTFQIILQQDVQEFIPYVFQLLSMLLELRNPKLEPNSSISEPYILLLPCLLAPVLWERPANVSPLVRLLCAFITNGPQQILSHLNGCLGVFQKLIASKTNDHEGFQLIQTMFMRIPKENLMEYHKNIFYLLFQRLSSSKTTKYVRSLIVFFSYYIIQFQADQFVDLVDSIQAQMIGMVIEKLFLTDAQKVNGNIEKKITACGITSLICDCQQVYAGTYQQYWSKLLEALIRLFELPQDETLFDDDHFIEVDDTPTFEQTTCSKLNYAARVSQLDPVPHVADVKQFLAVKLGQLSQNNPGQLQTKISQLEQNYQLALKEYITKYNINVA